MKKKERLVLIDVMKIAFALLIFFRHAMTMGGCQFGRFSLMIRQLTSPIMSGFFLLSGFSLYYTSRNKKIDGDYAGYTKNFYWKRAISILPIYFLVCILYSIFLENGLLYNLKLLIIEGTATHSFFDNTFTLLHNGTTWFVSCLVFCYFIYPHLESLLKSISHNKRIIYFIIFLLVMMYLPGMFSEFGITNTYANPLFRNLEFTLGVLFASVLDFDKIFAKRNWKRSVLSIGIFGVMFGILFYLTYYNYRCVTSVSYLIYILMIYVALNYKSIFQNNRVVSYLVNVSYPFYILQVFIWTKSPWVNKTIVSITNPNLRLAVFFSVLLLASTIVYYLYQVPISKFLSKKKK